LLHFFLALTQVLFDALSLAQEIRRVLARELNKFLERFHRNSKFFGELFMFLVRPRIAQSGESRMKHAHSIFEFAVETLQFIGKASHFLGIHDCLGHVLPFVKRSFRWGKHNGFENVLPDVADVKTLKHKKGHEPVIMVVLPESGCFDAFFAFTGADRSKNLVISELLWRGQDYCEVAAQNHFRHCHAHMDMRRLSEYAENLASAFLHSDRKSKRNFGLLCRKY
jgi:hypothetical protein